MAKRRFFLKTIELFHWAVCPKCKHPFLLDGTDDRISERRSLPDPLQRGLPLEATISDKEPDHV